MKDAKKKLPFWTRVRRSRPVQVLWAFIYVPWCIIVGVLLAAAVLILTLVHPFLRLSGRRGFIGRWDSLEATDKKGRVWAFGFGARSFRKLAPEEGGDS